MRVLILSTGVPFPPANGGLLRTYHLAHALSLDHEVTLVCFSFENPEPAPFPCRVIQIPWEDPRLYQEMISSDQKKAARATEILQHEIPEPWFASFYESPAMEEVIHREIPKTDLVIFEGSDTARFVPLFPDSMPKVMDFMDVHSAMFKRDVSRMEEGSKAKADAERELARIIQYEQQIASQTVLNLVCSELEAEHARTLLCASNLEIYPNGVDTSFYAPSIEEPEPASFLFVGTLNYTPNTEAVHYFAREIFPLIRKEIPTARFHIVGARPVKSVQELGKEPGIVFHGRVEDIRPYARRAAVFVIPLLLGGGTRLKILEGAALGKAMVSTTIGAEGLEMYHGSELLIADTPEDFAKRAIEFARNPEMRLKFGRRARQASLQYDWKKIEAKLRSVFASEAISTDSSTNPLVSIIINNYNYGRFVGEAIESALNQTYPHIEVIVVDDGSTDNSREAISLYHKKAKVIFKTNNGHSSGLNAGFAVSHGKIICFLDADDALFPNTIEKVAGIFQHDRNVVQVHWPLWVVDRNGQKTQKMMPEHCLDEGELLETIVSKGPDSRSFSPTSGNAWSKSFLNSIFPLPEVEKKFKVGSAAPDAYLAMLAPLYGSIRKISEPFGTYRIHGYNDSKMPFMEKLRRDLLKFDYRKEFLNRYCISRGIQVDTSKWKSGAIELNCAIDELSRVISSKERFILVDDEQWGIDETAFNLRRIPFLERKGIYWGPPPDNTTAIKELNRLNNEGVRFIVFAWPAFWWLDHYSELHKYLRGNFDCVLENDRVVVFEKK